MTDETTNLPAIAQEDMGLGFEDMGSQDFSAPFLVIAQGLSPYVQPSNTQFIPDCRQGMIVNTATAQVYTEINVIPCKYAFRMVEWKPRSMGGGFVASYSRDKAPSDAVVDPMTGRVKRQNGNELLATAYYLCLLQEEGFDKVIIPMYSTQLKKSRNWNTKMLSIKEPGATVPVPMFAYLYKLSTVAETNTKGTWYGWKIDNGDFVKSIDMGLYDLAKETYGMGNFLPDKLIEAVAQQQAEGIEPDSHSAL